MIRWPILLLALAGLAGPAAAQGMSGRTVYQHWCSACHDPGPGHPGTQALAAKYNGTPPAELERRTDLTSDVIRYTVRNGLSVMPIFRKTEITDADLTALVGYLTHAEPAPAAKPAP